MKKFELITGGIAALAIILKMLRVEGNSFLTVICFLTLCVFYYLGFALFNNIRLRDVFKSSSYAHTNPKKIIGSTLFGISLSMVLIGSLFKLQLWSGGGSQLALGLICLTIICVISVYRYSKSRDKFYIPIFKRLAIFGSFGLFLFLTPDSTLIDFYYRDNPELAELMKQSKADPDNMELLEQIDRVKEEINSEP